MRSSFNSLLFGASIMFSMTNAQFTPPKDDCDNENFTNSPVSGAPWSRGDGNTYFCDSRWKDGLVVCGIETWAYKYHQRGFRMKYSDGSWGPIHGRQMQEFEGDNWTGDYTKNKIEWDCAAPLKDLRMISNWPGFSKYKDVPDAVGGIRLTTPDGKDYFIHGDIGSFPGEVFNIGSGYLVGARGRSGGFLDTLEWRLLSSEVQSAEIKEMKFKKDLAAVNKQLEGIKEAVLYENWFKNLDNRAPWDLDIDVSRADKTTTTITHSTINQFGVKIGLTVSGDVGVPLLAKSKVELSTETSYSLTKSQETATSTESTNTFRWVYKPKVQPNSAMHCKAYNFVGRYEDEYTAVVVLTFKNGKKIEVTQPGKYTSVGWTTGVTSCETIKLEDAPKDAIVRPSAKRSIGMLKARAIGAHA